jgi:dATP pyrophosphohydrolase
MPRAPFQVLVLPYRGTAEALEFAVFHRSDYACWQGIAGGGEDDESPLDAAKREAFEEAGLSGMGDFLPLQASDTVPVSFFTDSGNWDSALYVIPQHFFGVDGTGQELALSDEHDAVEWLPYAEASARFTYDSNRTALWELNQRLLGLGPRDK